MDNDDHVNEDIETPGSGDDGGRGREARQPTEIPSRGWKDVLARTRAEVKGDNATLLSAGVAFYSLLALVPALVALVSLYGLIANPATVDRQVGNWLHAAPKEVRDLLVTQLKSITENAGAAAGVSVVIGILAALWSASSGMAHMVQAINIAYDERETRTFVKLRTLALVLTLGAMVFMVVAVGAIAVLPAVLAHTGLGVAGRILAGVARWVLLLIGMMAALSVLYRYAPDRDNPRWSWTSPGAIVATLIWLAASALFAVYAGNFGKYNQTYGSMGAVIVLMLWLFITALSVIIGAELNAEMERQTKHDTTEGPDTPLGSRGAQAADTVGATAEEVKAHS
jgi:membrane protein